MDALPVQLAEILAEIDAVNIRAQRLGNWRDDHQFGTRFNERSWSVAECLTHLTLTTKAFLPLIDRAFETNATRQVSADHRYRKDLMGRLMCWLMEPPVRLKLKTTAPFQPVGSKSRVEVMDEFVSLQSALAERIVRAAGRDLTAIRVVSPFDARANYNLYSAFKLILAHQRRHVWQAEQSR